MRDDHVGDLDEFAAGRTLRQLDDAVRADPVWEQATGLAHYRSLAQRQAVRTLLSSAEDATVLVLLPTGSGKSLVGLTHALTAGSGMVSVVVVPTTSLALDQEPGSCGNVSDGCTRPMRTSPSRSTPGFPPACGTRSETAFDGRPARRLHVTRGALRAVGRGD